MGSGASLAAMAAAPRVLAAPQAVGHQRVNARLLEHDLHHHAVGLLCLADRTYDRCDEVARADGSEDGTGGSDRWRFS